MGARQGAYFCFATLDLWRAAVLRWMSPFRAARSRRLTADFFSAGVDAGDCARLRAVRSAARWARFRTDAARDFLMFFFADAIRGKSRVPGEVERDRRGAGHSSGPVRKDARKQRGREEK